jgi:hypothetical protein
LFWPGIILHSYNPSYLGGGDVGGLWLGDSLGKKLARPATRRWLKPIILATQAAEIRRTMVRSQTGQIVRETVSQKTHHIKRAGVGPEFNRQYRKKKKVSKTRS